MRTVRDLAAAACTLQSRECQEWVVRHFLIGDAQCLDVAAAQIARFKQVAPAPAEPFAVEAHDQKISGQTREASVAIREGVDLREAMVEAQCDFVWRKCLVLDPVSDVADQSVQLYFDIPWPNADVLARGAALSSPGPDSAEHPTVKSKKDAFVENIALAGERPPVGIADPALLGFVQFAAKSDVAEPQTFALFGRKPGGGIIFLVNWRVAH